MVCLAHPSTSTQAPSAHKPLGPFLCLSLQAHQGISKVLTLFLTCVRVGYNQKGPCSMSPPRTFTPHELATLTADQVEALPPLDRQAFFLASAKATDPFYPWHLEGAGAGMPIRLLDLSVDRDLSRDLNPIASGRRFEIGE